jgi:hypothetical protein
VSQPINGSSPTEGTGGSDPRVTIISTYEDAPDSLEGSFVTGYKFYRRLYQFDGVQIYDPEFINLSDGYTIIP